jgi:hypothetical protein
MIGSLLQRPTAQPPGAAERAALFRSLAKRLRLTDDSSKLRVRGARPAPMNSTGVHHAGPMHAPVGPPIGPMGSYEALPQYGRSSTNTRPPMGAPTMSTLQGGSGAMPVGAASNSKQPSCQGGRTTEWDVDGAHGSDFATGSAARQVGSRAKTSSSRHDFALRTSGFVQPMHQAHGPYASGYSVAAPRSLDRHVSLPHRGSSSLDARALGGLRMSGEGYLGHAPRSLDRRDARMHATNPMHERSFTSGTPLRHFSHSPHVPRHSQPHRNSDSSVRTQEYGTVNSSTCTLPNRTPTRERERRSHSASADSTSRGSRCPAPPLPSAPAPCASHAHCQVGSLGFSASTCSTHRRHCRRASLRRVPTLAATPEVDEENISLSAF